MESEQTRREMQRPPASRGEEPGLGGRRVCALGALTCAGVLTPATRVRIDVTAHALRKGPPASRQRHSRYKDAAGVRLGVAQVPAATQGRGGGGVRWGPPTQATVLKNVCPCRLGPDPARHRGRGSEQTQSEARCGPKTSKGQLLT